MVVPGSKVLMADFTYKLIEDIRKGDIVWTATGDGIVEHAVKIGSMDPCRPMCKIGDLWITPYHPVLVNETWEFPATISAVTERMERNLYNLVLDHGHTVQICGVLTCTLGHGMSGEIIHHPFFGNKDHVLNYLSVLPGFAVGRPVFSNLDTLKQDGIVSAWYNKD